MNITIKPTVRRGASMVEVVIATLLTGVVIIGSLEVMGGAIKTRTTIATFGEGSMLAGELMAEVLAMPYEDSENPTGSIGLDSGETSTRSTFDDVDDYHNWTESPPTDIAGVAVASYTGWTREVWVNKARRDNGGSWFLETGLKRVRVLVTAPDGTATERYGYRWKEGSNEQSSPIDTEVVTWLGAELQIGAQGIARAGTNLTNTATD